MLRCLHVIYGVIFLAATTVLSNPDGRENWVQRCIDYSINAKFDSAEAVLAPFMEDSTTSLKAHFYYASVLNSKMTHFENLQEEAERFKSVLKKVIRMAETRLDENDRLTSKEKSRLYFYKGSATGYLAFYEGRKGSWYQAVKKGMQSVEDLEKSVELDRTRYDAYLGIGVYKYWRSTKLKFLLWLPLVDDMRDEGIRLIKKTTAHDTPSRYMAMHQLVYILLDYGRYDEALHYAGKIVEKYPASQFMLWAYAHTFFKRHEYQKAIKAYKRLLTLIERDPTPNPMHWLKCHFTIATMYYRMEQYEQTVEHCDTIIRRGYDASYAERGKALLEEVRNLKAEARKKAANKDGNAYGKR